MAVLRGVELATSFFDFVDVGVEGAFFQLYFYYSLSYINHRNFHENMLQDFALEDVPYTQRENQVTPILWNPGIIPDFHTTRRGRGPPL